MYGEVDIFYLKKKKQLNVKMYIMSIIFVQIISFSLKNLTHTLLYIKK